MSGHHKWSDIKHKRGGTRHTRPLVDPEARGFMVTDYEIKPAPERPTGGGDIPPAIDLGDITAEQELLRIIGIQADTISWLKKTVSTLETTLMAVDHQLTQKEHILDETQQQLYQAKHAVATLQHDLDVMTRRKDEYVDELQARDRELAECNVELHDNKSHRLGLMCAEAQEKLNKIEDTASRAGEGGYTDAEWLAAEILDILDGIE